MAGAFNGLFAAGQALSNAATGYQNYQTGQEDRATQATNTALQQQYLQQQIDAAQLANQEKQTSIANDEQLAKDAREVAASQNQPQSLHPGAVLAAAAAPANAIAEAGNAIRGLRQGQVTQQPGVASAPQPAGGAQAANPTPNSPGLTAAKGGLPATANGLPDGRALTPLEHSMITAESNGVASATSPAGAVGTAQTMPSTLREPGFGVAPARDNSPQEQQRVGVDYLGAMQKRYGNDQDALAAYNWGPAKVDQWIQGGRKQEELPPETRAYVSKVLGATQQQQQQAQGNQLAQSALAQPSPSSQIQAAEKAGVELTPVQYSAGVQAQANHLSQLRQLQQRAMASGNVKAAEALGKQADTEQSSLLDLRAKELDVKLKSDKEVQSNLANVTDQASYDRARATIAGNPDMQNSFRGLNATGDYEADKGIFATARDRSTTIAEQNANKIAQDKVQIEKQKNAREQQKIDAPKIAAAQAQQQAQQQDAQRREAAQKAGVPFVPSIAASVASGAKPADVQAARKANEAAWTARDKTYATSEHAQPQVMGEYQNLYNIATQHPEALGGAMIGPRQWAAQHGLVNTLDNNTVDFDKSSNRLVLLLQQSENPAAARSMGTAAMNANIAKTKPQVTMSAPEAAKLALEGYVKAGREVEHSKFIRTMRENNPDISPQVADTYWNHYSQAFPDTIRDPRTGEMVANTAMVPTLPDGTPNPKYQSYADWRKAGVGK